MAASSRLKTLSTPSKCLQTQVLAIGFLLVILSSALWKNYLPLLVVATYVIAPVPNWLCSRAANHDDFMESGGSGVVDFGRFLTGFLVVMGIGRSRHDAVGVEPKLTITVALPALFAHCALITPEAFVMSIIGGLLIYGTIVSFTMFFQESEEF